MGTLQINTKFTQSEVNKIDCLIANDQATSRSDVVRYAVRKYLDNINCTTKEASSQ